MPTGRSRSCFAFFAILFFTINKKTTEQKKNTDVRKKMSVITRKIVNQGVHNLFSPYRHQHFADSVRLCFKVIPWFCTAHNKMAAVNKSM